MTTEVIIYRHIIILSQVTAMVCASDTVLEPMQETTTATETKMAVTTETETADA